jgi:hypothetical protein
VDTFNLKELSELDVREEYQFKISNRFAALKNLHNSYGINRAWENIKNLSYKESRSVRTEES